MADTTLAFSSLCSDTGRVLIHDFNIGRQPRVLGSR